MPYLPPLEVLAPSNILRLESPLYGHSSSVSRGVVQDRENTVHRVYVKAFASPGYGLAGEVLFWALCKLSGLDCPDTAWLAFTPSDALSELWPDVAWEEVWGDVVPSFVTPDLAQVEDAVPATRQRLLKWPQLDKAIAITEWLANADPNLGNLIYQLGDDGDGRFALIDGGHCLGGPPWSPERLNTLRPINPDSIRPNKLSFGAYGDRLPSEARARILRAAERHHDILDQAEAFLRVELGRLLDEPPLVDAVLDVLRQRSALPWLKPASDLSFKVRQQR